jgi:LacI family transcriptional regulator
MKKKRTLASLKDVAEAARVSVTTVSRYLNGSLTLPERTRRRVETAIGELNYKPNPHARRLSLGRADTIGLVVPDIGNPFFAKLVASVEAAADRIGLGVVLCATLNQPDREIDYVERLRRNHVDGLIFVTNHTDDGSLAERINAAGRVVILDEDVKGTEVPKVFADNEMGGYLAGRHLAEFGHRRVAFVGGLRGMLSAEARVAGLRRALSEAGPDFKVVATENGEYTAEFGRTAARNLLQRQSHPTAVFASSDEVAIGILEVFRSSGLRVPEDISVVGFDDVGPLHLFGPPLTAVRQPVDAIGRRGVELLSDINQQGSVAAVAPEYLPVEIVVRASVGPPTKVSRRAATRRRERISI